MGDIHIESDPAARWGPSVNDSSVGTGTCSQTSESQCLVGRPGTHSARVGNVTRAAASHEGGTRQAKGRASDTAALGRRGALRKTGGQLGRQVKQRRTEPNSDTVKDLKNRDSVRTRGT